MTMQELAAEYRRSCALLQERIRLLQQAAADAADPTEQLLLERLSHHTRNRTVIIITHREATADLCDQVVNIE